MTIQSPMRILLVDDNRELLTSCRELLELQGHTVVSAASGEEALAEVGRIGEEGVGAEIDLLVSDLVMPGLDGGELASSLAALQPRARALFISAHVPEKPGFVRLTKAGFEILTKPFAPTPFLEAVERCAAEGPALGVLAHGSVAAIPKQPAARIWAGLAAAAVAVISLGLGLWTMKPSAPQLPDPSESSVRRGGVVEAVAPLGDVARVPVDLEWEGVAGARRYLLSVQAVDGVEIWSGEADRSPAALPLSTSAALRPAVVYYWSVVAVDDSGGELARSGPLRFKVGAGARDLGGTLRGGGEG